MIHCRKVGKLARCALAGTAAARALLISLSTCALGLFFVNAISAQTECAAKSAPGAAFSTTCSGMVCTFSVTSAAPPSGFANLQWDFGDGDATDGLATSASHTYPSGGGYFLVTLTVTAGDGMVAVATAGVSLGSPAVPLAAPDFFATDSGVPVVISFAELLANDAPGVSFDHVDPACVVTSATSCTYTPAPSFYGAATFFYGVRDATNRSGSAMVTVNVARPLVTLPDTFTAGIGTYLDITAAQLLANDSAGAMVVNAENGFHGTLQQIATTSLGPTYRFQLDSCFTGTATFEYLISWDGRPNPPTERGFVSVSTIDQPPIAIFTATCGQGGSSARRCTVSPTSSDDLLNCPGTTTHFFWNWGDGTPTQEVLVPPNTYVWAPQTHDYATSGRFTITHTLVDAAGQTGPKGTYQLEVLPNTKPVAVNDAATTERDVAVTIPLLANDSDADGDALMITGLSFDVPPGWGSGVVQLGNSWGYKYVPADTFVGTAHIYYQAADRWGAVSSTATVTVTVNQWTSITDALGEQLYTPQNVSLRIPLGFLLANDYDTNNAGTGSDPLHIEPMSASSLMDTSILMGTLDCTSDPSACTYYPPINAAGFTLFRYKACDPYGHCDTAYVRLYVGTLGHAPAPQDDYFTTPRNTAKTLTIQQIVANDSDVDNDTLTIGLISGARDFGSVACTTPMYSCTYTPNPGFVGTDRFPYAVTDMVNPALTRYINILTLPPSIPTFDAREDVRVTGTNQQAYIGFGGLAANDYDPEGDPIAVSSVDTTGMIGGTLINCDSFGCTFKPNWGYQGISKFKYTATDGHGSSDVAIVKVRVAGSNVPPTPMNDSLTTSNNQPLRFSVFALMANDFDEDNDPLAVTIYPATTARGTIGCDAKNYWCTYTPYGNQGSDVLTYYLSDGTVTVPATLTIITP